MIASSITTLSDLEEELSRPSDADRAFLQRLEGDIMILGAGGKMGPSLARLCRRAAQGTSRRVIAVSRFTNEAAAKLLTDIGIEVISCDLFDRDQIARLPQCPNILYLAGRKFGSAGNPEVTWAMNTLVPSFVADHFRQSRVVVFSTGNVYPLRAPATGGSREKDLPGPVGEYAQSCLGRERIFEYYSNTYGLRCLFFRLNYAVDLRYGVLVDIARKVQAGDPVGLTVPAFNVIWQRDANSYALRSLELCATPPKILNVTGEETIAVRTAAEFFASRFNKPCRFEGVEGSMALLSDSSESRRLLGPPSVSSEALLNLVAAWVERGGELLDKPTRFEVTDGRF